MFWLFYNFIISSPCTSSVSFQEFFQSRSSVHVYDNNYGIPDLYLALNHKDPIIRSRARALNSYSLASQESGLKFFNFDQLDAFCEQGFLLREDFDNILAGYKELERTRPDSIFQPEFSARTISKKEVDEMSALGFSILEKRQQNTRTFSPFRTTCLLDELPNAPLSRFFNASVQMLFPMKLT